MHAVVERWLEWWHTGDVSVADRLYAATYERHADDGATDVGAVKSLVSMYRTAFPDLHFDVQDTLTEGDRVAVRWWATGTHQGPLRGMEPSGRRIGMPGCDILRITDDRLLESWSFYDRTALMSQLQG